GPAPDPGEPRAKRGEIPRRRHPLQLPPPADHDPLPDRLGAGLAGPHGQTGTGHQHREKTGCGPLHQPHRRPGAVLPRPLPRAWPGIAFSAHGRTELPAVQPTLRPFAVDHLRVDVQPPSRGKARAEETLRRQHFECYRPQKHGKTEEPLFPGYLFIRLDRQLDNWYPIRSTRGVARVISFGGEPTPVRDELIEQLRERLAAPAE